MKQLPTDREILKQIHDSYYDVFCSYDADKPDRSSKIYVPVDCKQIAQKFNVDEDIIFGRLYYHLEKKHGYTQDDGAKVHLFALKAGKDNHVVNFPLLSALVAEHQTSWFRFNLPIVISVTALLLSIIGNIGK